MLSGGEMGGQIQFGGVVFEESFLFVRRGTRELKLTRSERALLQIFTRNIRRVLTRDQLLDAVSGGDSETSDRNIDYLINRLRAKLGDSARAPSLIATQYGEGYVWLADPEQPVAPVDALLVIGPVFGLDYLELDEQARNFLRRLQGALDAQTASDQIVLLDETGDALRSGQGRVRYSLDISFHEDHAGLHCAAVLREVVGRQILKVLRLALSADGPAAGQPDVWAFAEAVKSAMWERLTFAPNVAAATPQDEPLELRIVNAGILLSRLLPSQCGLEGAEQLARERERNPDDPRLSLMWATCLYCNVARSYLDRPVSIEACASIAAEIETLVLDSLPALQDNPIDLLGAAKLLLFTGRGHIGLAAELAERAFASSAAFAATFSVLGQIQACLGNMDAARKFYERGLELSGPDSEFRAYLMVIKLHALLAAGDRPALDASRLELYAYRPSWRMSLDYYYAPPGQLPDDLRLQLERFDASQARGVISFGYYIAARLFQREEHRENMMRGVVSHMTSRFGPDVVPEQVWRAAPRLRAMYFDP